MSSIPYPPFAHGTDSLADALLCVKDVDQLVILLVKFVLDYVQHNLSHIFPSEEALTYSLFKQFHENHNEDFGTLPHIDRRTTTKILSWFVSSARATPSVGLTVVQIRDASKPPPLHVLLHVKNIGNKYSDCGAFAL
jgi:hypothetical protein